MNDLNKAKWNINSITIDRNDYTADKTFKARVTLMNTYQSKMEIAVDSERTLAIIDIISDLILDQLNIELTNMREIAVALVAEQKLKELPAPIEGSV